MLTVFYRDKLLYPADGISHIHIVLELQNDFKTDVLKDIESFKRLIPAGIKYAGKQEKNWMHFAAQTIVFEDLRQDLPQLAEKVSEYVNSEAPLVKLGEEILIKLEMS